MIDKAIVWATGMVIFAIVDAIIVLVASSTVSIFSPLWWCLALLAGIAMCISLYCEVGYIKCRKDPDKKYSARHIITAFLGNLVLIIIVMTV